MLSWPFPHGDLGWLQQSNKREDEHLSCRLSAEHISLVIFTSSCVAVRSGLRAMSFDVTSRLVVELI